MMIVLTSTLLALHPRLARPCRLHPPLDLPEGGEVEEVVEERFHAVTRPTRTHQTMVEVEDVDVDDAAAAAAVIPQAAVAVVRVAHMVAGDEVVVVQTLMYPTPTQRAVEEVVLERQPPEKTLC